MKTSISKRVKISIKFTVSEPSGLYLYAGTTVVAMSMYAIYFILYDVLHGDLLYFNVLGNKESFSWIAFLLIPLPIIPLLFLHVIILRIIKRRLMLIMNSKLIASCTAASVVGVTLLVLFFFYQLLFIPFSWTILGLNLYLIMSLMWAYYYIYSSPRKPKVPQLQALLGQVAVLLAISSTLFFFFPNTVDMRMLAETGGNYHYFYFTFGQYGLIASTLVLGIIFWHVVVQLEWTRVRE